MPKIVDVEQRRAELADAAARLIARSGIEAATMREVAAEAGLTTGALTHYFTDKHELLLTTFQASLARRRSLRPPAVDTPPSALLLAALEGALPLDDDRRLHWLVTIACCAQATGDADLARAQQQAYEEFSGYVTGLVRACAIGQRRDAADTAAMLIAAADGIAVQALFHPDLWPAARQRTVLLRMVAAHGLVPAAG
jgi:TetR/AcrR family transcriptional repressor of bet genes